MAKGGSLSDLFGRLTACREVKTFDNQRNAKQVSNVVHWGQRTKV
jgi:hypothetical protein